MEQPGLPRPTGDGGETLSGYPPPVGAAFVWVARAWPHLSNSSHPIMALPGLAMGLVQLESPRLMLNPASSHPQGGARCLGLGLPWCPPAACSWLWGGTGPGCQALPQQTPMGSPHRAWPPHPREPLASGHPAQLCWWKSRWQHQLHTDKHSLETGIKFLSTPTLGNTLCRSNRKEKDEK